MAVKNELRKKKCQMDALKSDDFKSKNSTISEQIIDNDSNNSD